MHTEPVKGASWCPHQQWDTVAKVIAALLSWRRAIDNQSDYLESEAVVSKPETPSPGSALSSGRREGPGEAKSSSRVGYKA